MTERIALGEPPAPAALALAADALGRGQIVAYPTDTLYALGVDPRRQDAVLALARLKTRGTGAGLTLVASDLAQVETCLGPLPPLGRRLAERWWPGPLTLVYQPATQLDPTVHARNGTLAVRVANSEAAIGLTAAFGHPLTATSANLAGAPPAATGAAVAADLGAAISLILEQDGSLVGSPSTIVDVQKTVPGLIREGAIAWDRVLQSARA